MARILIIGAGGVSSVVVHKCAQAKEVFTEIHLASRTKSKCDAIAESVKKRYGVTIHTASVDADNVADLVTLIKKVNPVMVLNVALPYQDLTIMDACLECNVHYLDTANYEPIDLAKFEYKWQWAYQDKFKEKGLPTFSAPMVKNIFSMKCMCLILLTLMQAIMVFLLPRILTLKSISVKLLPAAVTGNAANGLKQIRFHGK